MHIVLYCHDNRGKYGRIHTKPLHWLPWWTGSPGGGEGSPACSLHILILLCLLQLSYNREATVSLNTFFSSPLVLPLYMQSALESCLHFSETLLVFTHFFYFSACIVSSFFFLPLQVSSPSGKVFISAIYFAIPEFAPDAVLYFRFLGYPLFPVTLFPRRHSLL